MRKILARVLVFFCVTAGVALAQQPARTTGITVNFVDARLADVIRSLAMTADISVVMTDVPDKRISFTTASPVTKADVASILETILESNGLTMIQKGVVAQVLPVERAPAQSLHTYVVPLHFASASELAISLSQVFGTAVMNGRNQSLDDRSLSRNLDAFRQREAQAFQMRRDTLIRAPAISTPAIPSGDGGVSSPAGGSGNLVGQTTVIPDLPTNSLIIRTIPPNFPVIRETVQALDVRPPQVLLEVLVAEITLNRSQQFGIDWSAVTGSTTGSFGTPVTPDSTRVVDDLVLKIVSLDRHKVKAVLSALAAKSDVRILSTPEILATNNREAHILVGSKVPFVVSTRLGNDIAIDRTVQFQDVGTNLTIVPTINQDNYVSVQILQEVSTLTTQTVPSALNAPVISTREASTRATIRNGQTVVIGGLIGGAEDYIDTGIPFLKDIPLIGNLFKRQSRSHSRNELAIFVTPYIVRTDAEADSIRARIRARMDSAAPGIFGDSTRTVPPPSPTPPHASPVP
ncbi:MAG: hypothetical protein M3Z17_02435 [Gemmatimonadota bacterium]|nr:hypothetical protein [Gemmatimonadota bacterium]